MKLIRGFIATALMLASSASIAASSGKALEVIVFPGGFNWPVWAAQEKGFFADNDVAVNLTLTPSSTFQLSGLIDGKFDIAMTAIDNLVAYREGQGEVDKVGKDLVAVMGGDRGFLKLVTVPEVPNYEALKGKTLSVDARNTGYALVLFELLDRAGLQEPDFKIERAGGVMQRFGDLMEKKHEGTMLISPFEVEPVSKGYHVLATASETFGAYQGYVAGVRQSWAQENSEALKGYIRAYVQGVEWLYDPSNKEEALAIFRKYLPKLPEGAAVTAYDILLEPETGMQRKAAIEMDGVEQVLKLRSKWGIPKMELTDPSKYYDPTYYDAAVAK